MVGRYNPALYPAMFPAIHVLTKANGDRINVAWDVRNDGDAGSFATLLVFVGEQPTPPKVITAVGPGLKVQLSLAITLAGQPIGQVVAARVFMMETSAGGTLTRNMISHDFTVNITAVGPILVAVEEPTIT